MILDKLPEHLRNHKNWNYMIKIDKKAFGFVMNHSKDATTDKMVVIYKEKLDELNK